MTKAPKEIFASLEIGRFLAASIVVLTHFCGDLPRYGTGTAAHRIAALAFPTPLAVQYFFVLSGYVMMTAHRRDFGRLSAVWHFWWRRACRIYPMYWLGFALVTIYLYPVLTPRLAFVQMSLLPVSVTEFVSPAWTLRYEMAFYIMFGLCLLPYIGRVLLAAWVFSVFWLWRPAALSGFLLCAPTNFLKFFASQCAPLFFAPFEIYFFMGLAAGAVSLANTRVGIAAFLLGVAILIGAGPQYQWGYTYGGPLTPSVSGLGLALLIIGCVALERGGTLRAGAWARRLGAISYPLYILHIPIMLCVDERIWGRWHFHGVALLAFGAAYLALVFALSAAAAFLIDRPLQRVFKKIKLPGGKLRTGLGTAG